MTVTADLWGLLQNIGVEDLQDLGDEIQARCPRHPHYEERPDNWSINWSTGAHNCFSCGFHGSLHRLVMDLAGVDVMGALDLMHDYGINVGDLGEGVGTEHQEQERDPPTANDELHRQFNEQTVDPPERALEDRKISLDTAWNYDIAWDPERSAWALPIKNPDGDFLGWQSKSKDSVFTTKGTEKSRTLFGLDRVRFYYVGRSKAPRLVLVESPLDVAYLHEVGYRNQGVASMGVKVSATQTRLLAQYAEEVIVALDNDEAGRAETRRVVGLLAAQKVPTKVLEYSGAPGKKDIGEMTAEEVKAAMEHAAPLEQSRLIRLSGVTPKKIDWLWLHWIPQGELVVVEARKALGKSTLVCDLISRVTTGDLMPDDTSGIPPTNVLYLAGEESVDKVLRRRLEMMGADLDRVLILDKVFTADGGERDFEIPDDLDEIVRRVVEFDAHVLVIDVLNNFLGDKVDTDRDHSVRRALRPLAEMAQTYDLTIIAIRHLRKSREGGAIDQGIGSVGIAGQARAVLRADFHTEEPDLRVLSSVVCNLGPMPCSLGYQITQKLDDLGALGVVSWQGPVDITAEDLASAVPGGATAVQEAAEFLTDLGQEHDGKVLSAEVEKQARENDIAARTLARAKKKLGIRSTADDEKDKEGKFAKKVWYWIWPHDHEAADDSTLVSSNGSRRLHRVNNPAATKDANP
jgi:hypothetical protein